MEARIRRRNLIISAATCVALLVLAYFYAVPVLRISVITDEQTFVVKRKLKPLTEYLEQQVGKKIEFRPMRDGSALVDGLLAGKLDMVWIDGFHLAQARTRSNGGVMPIVQRAEDEHTASVFFTRRNDMREITDLKGRTLAFVAKTSASGYLMPHDALLAAQLRPEADIKAVFSGAPVAVAAAVANGDADAGVTSNLSWQLLAEQGRVDALHVFYTTPSYRDYSWAVRSDMDAELRRKLSDAFLALSRGNSQGSEILEYQRASRYIPARAEDYDAIDAAAQRAGVTP